MGYFEMPAKYFELIKLFYECHKTILEDAGEITEGTNMQSGVKQACVLSLFLIILMIIQTLTAIFLT